VKKELLQQMIDFNRKNGYKGECTFYFESLKKWVVIIDGWVGCCASLVVFFLTYLKCYLKEYQLSAI